MTPNRPLAAVLLVVLALAVFFVRWEEWEYRDGAGLAAFQYRGLLLPWQEAQAPPPGTGVATVVVHKRTVLGFNRFDYAGPPASMPPVALSAARTPGR